MSNEERLDEELRRFLDWQAGQLDGSPGTAEMVIRVSHHKARRSGTGPSIRLILAIVGVASLLAAIGGAVVGSQRPGLVVIPSNPFATPALVTPGPTPGPTPDVFSLAPDPLLTGADWTALTGATTLTTRSATQGVQPLDCLTDPGSLGASELRSASFVAAGEWPGAINEFVLRYDDADGAAQAYGRLRDVFRGCRQVQIAFFLDDSTPANPWPFAGQLIGETSIGRYQIGLARDANVIVLLESTGWGDRTTLTLQLAMLRAIPVERDRCATVVPSPSALCQKASASTGPSPRPGQPVPLPASGTLDSGTYALLNPASLPGGSCIGGCAGYKQIIVTLPPGWATNDGLVSKHLNEPGEVAFSAWTVDQVYANPCQWQGSALSPLDLTNHSHGPTGIILAPEKGGLANQALRGPLPRALTQVTLGGVLAVRINLSVPAGLDIAACDEGQFRSWTEWHVVGGANSHNAPGQLDAVYMVDVDRRTIVIDADHMPGASKQDLAELQAILKSMIIDRGL